MRRALPYLGLLLIASVFAVPQFGGEIEWTADGLYYEAQSRELRGESAEEARREVWRSDLSEDLYEEHLDDPPEDRRYDEKWIEYSAQFYRRRWLVPAAAAATEPVLGIHALETISILGYMAIGPLLFLLLRRRFSVRTSFAIAAACLLVPQLRTQSFLPLTDSWGIALILLSLLAALQVFERGPRWLPLWVLAMLALSFTRDYTIVPLVGVAWVAFANRSRAQALLPLSGVLAAAPAPLLFSVPITDFLAYNFADFHVPDDTSVGYIARHYIPELVDLVACDLGSPLLFAGFTVGALAIASLYRFAPSRDDYFRLHHGAAPGALAIILISVNCSGLRLELVFLAPAAVGLALALERFRPEWFRPT